MTTLLSARTDHPAAPGRSSVRELEKARLVRAAVAECAAGLRVHETAAPVQKQPRHRIPGCNPDATPC